MMPKQESEGPVTPLESKSAEALTEDDTKTYDDLARWYLLLALKCAVVFVGLALLAVLFQFGPFSSLQKFAHIPGAFSIMAFGATVLSLAIGLPYRKASRDTQKGITD